MLRNIFLKNPINYPYFIFLTLSIFVLSLIHALPLNLPLPLFGHLLIQSLFEIALFAFFAQIIKSNAPKKIYFLLPTVFFTILMVHFTNFILMKVMDVRLTYLLNFFVGHGPSHVITVFQAINMNQTMMAFIGILLLSIPVIGIGIYQFFHKTTNKREIKTSSFQIFCTLCLSLCFLLIFEWIAFRNMPHSLYTKYAKTTPLGATFFSPSLPKHTLPKTISLPYDPTHLEKEPLSYFSLDKPNIYLFIIETFRDDFISEEIAPHLTLFGKENIRIPHSYANANSTQNSWFAIFHSLFPYHWTEFRKTPNRGSTPLWLLKNLGYKIHVYASADLSYFDMDKEIFGPNRMFADTMFEYASDRSIQSWQRDARVMESFEKEVRTKEGKEENVYLFFLDATHSEYSFPENLPYKFAPITDKIDYLGITKENLEPIKNRYRNAIHYIDSLLDQFFSLLKEENIYDRGIIAITGDHGEEFFEDGSLFHGSHLNREQTNVPILFKFPQNDLPLQTDTATHVDIFPTILHFLDKNIETDFDGRSIFSKDRWPYRLATLQNGAKTPFEFTIENESFKLRARFLHPENIYKEKEIEILSLEGKLEKDLGEVFQFLTRERRLPKKISCKQTPDEKR